ncbi:Protein of unknown function [Rhizobium sp. NFR07]|uniref:DUF2721 domain-containing protein n=1 Tax=Rhizobium sp. NFR07 TaxID=1566262 RepID=UPI0008E4908D|nr:DUF2721 domain-containing protein [Rhizobium sp. NFR07]SFB46262.1 Protein of unknown function [Rhizobium sp. NFR07]
MDAPLIINEYAAIIQTSLAPVFLLAGTAAFVSIYSLRLGRVADRLNEVGEREVTGEDGRRWLHYLRCRTLILEVAVVLGVLAGLSTCSAILNLLGGSLAIRLRPENLPWFFGGAIVCLMLSLIAFLMELMIAGRSMLVQMKRRP